ncbi:hypothetical protein P691DRAFT_351245 [Macrolepiota fuliginosa MF-IS2]|uniref:Uncharacterized protein n=1 Tax=Macrolepiota fuliginosa MF-IS2 TaxID=1400762 RepID=A0A9P5X4E5_9AGAR|nr:hypothetical protein P691DRAFT_351245 [Macrolepiota fuliginosa MF-IS2]
MERYSYELPGVPPHLDLRTGYQELPSRVGEWVACLVRWSLRNILVPQGPALGTNPSRSFRLHHALSDGVRRVSRYVGVRGHGSPARDPRPSRGVQVAEPSPSIIQSHPSDEVPIKLARPSCDLTERLERECELISFGSWIMAPKRKPLLGQICTVGQGSSHIGMWGSEGGCGSVLDVIDNSGVPVEDGQVLFPGGAAGLMNVEAKTGNRLKSVWSEDSITELTDVEESTRGEEIGRIESKTSAEASVPAEQRSIAAAPLRVRVAPQDYLRVPGRSFRRT